MTNSKSTKRSLLTSSISLLLSFAMLLGTTFAWFTDSVSVGNNVIKSGNLDVELWYWDNGMQTNQSVNLEDESDLKLLRNADGEEILWEPGALGFGQFEVKNEGSLALKYELKLNFEDVVKTPDGKSLSDVLTVYAIARGCNEGSEPGMGDPDLNQFVNNWDSPINGFNGIPLNDFTLDGYLLPGESFTYEIRAYWKPSDKDNDYNVKDGLQIDFGVTLLATQMTYEKDSVNEMYDEKATMDVIVSNSEELKKAVANGETKIYLNDGEYDIDGCGGKTLTLNGSKNAVIKVVGTGAGEANGQLDYGFDSSNVTFNGVTIKTNNQTYAGYARLNGIYNNCTFENTYCLNGTSEFNNCTLNIQGDQYNIWTWGSPEATFNNCTFNSDGKAILLYGSANTKLTVNNCTFNDSGILPDLKAAIEIGNDYNKSYELIVNNTTVNGYAINDKGINTNSTLWANKNSMGTDKLNVVVDNVDVY